MSGDILIAIFFCVLALISLILVFLIARSQKTILDDKNNPVTEVELKFLGKMKTSYPSLVLGFFGIGFGFFAYQLTANRSDNLIEFNGSVNIQEGSVETGQLIVVGISSTSWRADFMSNGGSGEIPVTIKAPDSWQSYNVFAFATGKGVSKPDVQGTRKDKPTFKVSIRK